MDSNFLDRVIKDKKIKISELPDDLDITSLPEDTEIILDERFPDLEEDFWEDKLED